MYTLSKLYEWSCTGFGILVFCGFFCWFVLGSSKLAGKCFLFSLIFVLLMILFVPYKGKGKKKEPLKNTKTTELKKVGSFYRPLSCCRYPVRNLLSVRYGNGLKVQS